jgi:hypothetical protein
VEVIIENVDFRPDNRGISHLQWGQLAERGGPNRVSPVRISRRELEALNRPRKNTKQFAIFSVCLENSENLQDDYIFISLRCCG